MGKWKTFTLEEVGGEEAGEEKEEGEGEEEEAKERTSGRRDSESRYLQRERGINRAAERGWISMRGGKRLKEGGGRGRT
jgi:hypothetical protein